MTRASNALVEGESCCDGVGVGGVSATKKQEKEEGREERGGKGSRGVGRSRFENLASFCALSLGFGKPNKPGPQDVRVLVL